MIDERPPSTYQERLRGILHPERNPGQPPKKDADPEGIVEESYPAFGYLRGQSDASSAIEFRFGGGKCMYFPYSCLGAWQFDPAVGILLKFNGDVTYLVLILGSNLDLPVNEGAINLTRGGLQRHRVVWIREMAEEEIKQVGETGPTIDSIQVAEFESNDALKEWLGKHAPAFLPKE
jgi:hypothetical protein